MRIESLSSLQDVSPTAWDALTGKDNPFVEHAFLRGLELSGSVGTHESGWLPCYLIARDAHNELCGALPLYMRTDSYGEFIFDWGWADAASRAGIAYYPKLTSAVPFTPATGARLLIADIPVTQRAEIAKALVAGALSLVQSEGLSGLHVLFHQKEEAAYFASSGMVLRTSFQYHWHRQPHWHAFEDYLADMRSAMRKQVRRERKQATQSGLKLSMRRGTELSAEDWEALYQFYRVTVWEKGAQAYLTEAFFCHLRDAMPERVCAALAHDAQGIAQAGALYLTRGKNLYGRYWGSLIDAPSLHFELCYYLPIEWALANGIERFEAGAQGEHKLRRGLLPNACYSSHWLAHPGLMSAVCDFVKQEAQQQQHAMDALMQHGPFHRPHSPESPAL